MADGRLLDSQQQSALVACLRAIGDGELHVERARCQLCEDRSFDAFEAFKNLQGPHFNQKGWVSAHDLYVWFSVQPHSLASASLEEVAGMLQPFVNQLGELRYEGFLRLVLPKDPAHAWLKEIALMKGAGSQSGWRGDHDDKLPSEVQYRVCQLFEAEMEMYRHLKFHRQNLHALAVYRDRLMRFFDVESGTFAGAGGLICPSTVRRLVIEKLQALSEQQCDALLRRINPTGAYFAAFDELARFVTWTTGPSASLFPSQPGPAPGSTITGLPRQKSGSLDHSHVSCHSSVTPGRHASPNRLPLDTSRSFSESAILGVSHSTPAPRLREPVGPLVSRMPEPPRSPVSSPRVKSRPGTWETSPGLPPRPSASLVVGSRDSFKEGLSGGAGPISRQLCAGAASLPPEPARKPVWSPEQKSFALDTTRASTSEIYSPRSPCRSYRSPWRTSAVGASASVARSISPPRGACAAATSRPLSPRRPSSPWPPTSPARRGSSPLQSPRRRASHAWMREASAEAMSRPSSVPPGQALSRLSSQSHLECASSSRRLDRAWMSDNRDQMLKAALQLMLRQADTDARCEEAKVLLPSGCPLEAIFECLDRFRKGSVTETDLWQFSQDYAGTTSYASLASLVHEVQLRRPKDQSSVPGRLSLRETGILVLPLNTREHDAVLQAATDAEARRVLHLIRDYRTHDPAMAPRAEPLVGAVRYQLYRLIDASARAAEDLNCFRSQLALTPGYDLSALSDVFHRIAHGKLSMSMADLRHAFFQLNMMVSESQLGLIWHRYLPYGSTELTFPDFARQLKPRSAIG